VFYSDSFFIFFAHRPLWSTNGTQLLNFTTGSEMSQMSTAEANNLVDLSR